MKKLPILLLAAVLALCSCSKSYQELVNEKVEQYKKDGKIILNKSDDPTGKEHYIVFADAKQQTIGVDTLGEEAQIINIQKLKKRHLMVPDCQDYEPFTTISPYTYGYTKLRITKNGEFEDNDGGGLWNIKCYKNKYLIISRNNENYKSWSLLFFQIPSKIFSIGGDVNIPDSSDGKLRITLTSYEAFFGIIYKSWVSSTYHFTFDNNGNIIAQDDYVNYEGINIPITAFGDPEKLKPYIERITINL